MAKTQYLRDTHGYILTIINFGRHKRKRPKVSDIAQVSCLSEPARDSSGRGSQVTRPSK
jgi:hypothetical protein